MSVEISIPQFLQPAANVKVVYANGRTVGECFKDLIEQYPQLKSMLFDGNGKLHGYLNVYINGESAYPGELRKRVHSGDRIQIVNIIAGG